MNSNNPIEMIAQVAENQLTTSIVTAARNNKINDKSLSVDIEEMLENIVSKKYAEEVAMNLTRIFGSEFEPIADKILEFANKLTSSKTTSVKKDKKPYTKKINKPASEVAITDSSDSSESVTTKVMYTSTVDAKVAEKPAKKPRAKKVKDTIESTHDEQVEDAKETTTDAKVSEKPTKKPRAKKVKDTVESTHDEQVEDAKETTTDANVAEKPAKKPRAKKVKDTVESTHDEQVEVAKESTTDAKVSEKPAKKPRAKKVNEPVIEVKETTTNDSMPLPIEEIANPIEIHNEDNSILLRDDDLDVELAGFSEEWTHELVEEELSDIELEDD